MSISVMTWVFEHSRSKKNARLVLLAIADCANDEGRQAYPSMAKLRQKTGLGDRAVTSLVADLEKLGELAVDRNAGPRGCNLYRIVMTPADSAPPQEMRGAGNAGDPAGNAPPQILHPRRKRQTPPQKSADTPADPAPGTIKEPSKNHHLKPSRRKRTDETPRPDVDRVCKHLADRMIANGCRAPDITPKWREAARLLIDKDGRTTDQIVRCIDWATNDTFWRKNILSMPTLREKYDRLRLAAEDERNRLNARATPARHQTYRNPTDQSIYEGAL